MGWSINTAEVQLSVEGKPQHRANLQRLGDMQNCVCVLAPGIQGNLCQNNRWMKAEKHRLQQPHTTRNIVSTKTAEENH